jgi:hypothetical protein
MKYEVGWRQRPVGSGWRQNHLTEKIFSKIVAIKK